jgi:hypothetical protein
MIALPLGTETGFQLWVGNNPYTFSHYPQESMDASQAVALDALPASEQAELAPLESDEARWDRWFLLKAFVYMREHPAVTIANAFRKVGAAFSWLPSPRRAFWPTLVYLLSYGPVMTLGLAGMIFTRRSWRQHSIVFLLFLSFVAVTAVFFGHTSHRSFLDMYWMVYAAGLLTRRT